MIPASSLSLVLRVLAGGGIGGVLFLWLIGPSPLDVKNVDWLLAYDTGAHYMAWAFFRLEPWSFPLGRMHLYGAEFASNIVFADGIPLLSLPLKVLSPFLPADFQFFGWWAMGCFALQGMAGVWLLSRFSSRIELQLFGAAFFAMQPVMLHRFGWHFSLMGQWLIPLGFVLFFCAPRRWVWLGWMVLLVAGAAIHAYLQMMVLVMFAVWVLREATLLIQKKAWAGLWHTVLGAAGVGGAMAAAMAALDYFRPMMLDWGSGKTFGGVVNLVGAVLPTAEEHFLLPAHAKALAYQHEGFWYLGAGVLVLLAVAAGAWVVRRKALTSCFLPLPHSRPMVVWALFFAVLLFFFILSTGLVFTWGQHVLFEITLPQGVQRMIDIFRWVGRFIWPVATGLLFLALLGTCLLPRPLAACVLAVGLGIQLWDVRGFAQRDLQEKLTPKGQYARLQDARWDVVLPRHQGISVIPYPFKRYLGMEYDLALLACRYGKKIDAAYYARYPRSRQTEPVWQRFHNFWRGRPDPGWLYVVQEELLKRKNLHAWAMLLPSAPLLWRMDGYYVASFASDSMSADSVPEWPLEELSAGWTELRKGSSSFAAMGDGFDRLFLGGFEPHAQGARLNHDLGVLAFRWTEGGASLKLRFVPTNPSERLAFSIKGKLLHAGEAVAEEQARPEMGWSEEVLLFENIPAGDYLLRVEVEYFEERSGRWLPRRGSSVVIVEVEVL